MIDKETRKSLLSNIVRIKVRGLSDEQKNRFLQVHESYLRLLPLKLTTPNAIIDDCKRIEDASKRYLRAIRAPEQLPQEEQKKFYITKAQVEACVEAYSDLAKECRATYQGLWKRGRPRHWQKRLYIHQMAKWYEDVKGKKPRSGTYSLFPVFLRACFDQIAARDSLSDSVIRRALQYYYSTERAQILKILREEGHKAKIPMKKIK